MDTNEVKDAISKDVTLQRRALFGLVLLAVLLTLAAVGGIKGCELKHGGGTPAAAAAVHHEVPIASVSMRDMAHGCAVQTDRELAPTEMRLFGRTFPVHRDPPAPLPLTLMAVAPIGLPIMKYFRYDHLPEKLRGISKPIGALASMLATELPDCAEKSAGLRKLLEAKDCFVRAALEEPLPPGDPANIPGSNQG